VPANRPGPKPRLSRERVVAVAVELGVERVSIAAVAEALGVAQSGLYRYIDGRDDLVAAALEAVFADEPLPPGDRGWRTYLETEAWSRWTLLRRYPGLVRRYEGRLASVAMARFEQLVRGLMAFGLSAADALLAVDSVLDLIHDAAEQTARLRDPDDPARMSAEMQDALARYPADIGEALAEVLADPQAHTARKLAIVLDGIDVRVHRSPR
jgi:AcrR family transcriptional regulator